MISKKSIILHLIALFTSTSVCAQTEVTDGVTYDVVTITVDAPSYDNTKPPVFARVKYNKLCPLVITSDDMGGCELNRNWAFFNGYPVFDSKDYGHIPTGYDFLETPYNSAALSIQNQTLKRDNHQPLTYSDGTGGVRRFTATSAIWPHHINSGNYTLMTPNDAKVMIRTGWSFAQHDVDNEYTTDATTIAGRFKALSDLWEGITGIGLKVLVEPSGTHKYIDAGKMSDEICWNIFQNGVIPQYPEMTNTLISDWTTAGDWTTFGNNKPEETTRRIFFQGNENEFTNAINNADGTKFIIGGTHGIGDNILTFLKDLDKTTGTSEKKDQFWVAGADEVWEYYHLYNNAKITDVSYADKILTFKVKVPQYKKNQFREMTINIPGITGGTTCTFSNNVITGSAQQNAGQYTINFGVENKIYTHIEELITYYRSHLHNEYVKDDAQYLINLLAPGEKKDNYQAQLNAEPNYSYTIKNSFGTTLLEGASDLSNEVYYKYPKYILNENTLYEAAKNPSVIQNKSVNYVKSYTPTGKNEVVIVDYNATDINKVAFYTEGEDISGVTIATQEYSKITENSGVAYCLRFASNGAAGEILSPVTVTNIPKGKYTLVAAIGDTHTSNTAQFTFKVGDKSVLSLTTEDVSGYIKEYRKESITVKTDQPLIIEAVNSGGSFWVDYLYLIKTGEYDESTPDVELTTETETATVDMTDNSNKTVTITATSTAKGGATIVNTVIKDSNDQIVAQSTAKSPNTCSYTFTPSHVGDFVFTAEATDDTENGGMTGLSDELTITVQSDFILTAKSSMGDDIGSITFSGKTADMTYRFMYPRYTLRGTNLYETEALSTDDKLLHYGENIEFTLANNKITNTITYTPVATNIIYYTEGEDIEGARTWTWEGATLDYGKGETWALTLGSMGKCGAVTDVTVTTIPAGKYKIYAGFGTTNVATYTIKLGDTAVDTYTTTSIKAINEYSYETSTLTEPTPLKIHCNKGKDNSQNWIDYIYIQKLDDVPVKIGSTGYATFSSPYALDFTGSDIKAYTATVTGDKVMMNKVTGSVPAETGLFLQGSEGTMNIPLATIIPPTIVDNALMPHLETGIVAAGNYVFSRDKNTGDLSFRRLTSDTEVPGGRAYLSVPGEARSLTIEMDDVTGIRFVPLEPTMKTSPAYNIQGLPVSEHTKGMIIRNGRKYINTKKQ